MRSAPVKSDAGRRFAFASAFGLSALGFELLTFLMTVKVFSVSGRAIDVGLLLAISVLPKLAGPFLGSIVDRMDKSRAMASAALALAASSVALAFAPTLAAVYCVWLAASTAAAFASNARTVLMTETYSGESACRGNSLVLAILGSARFVAPLAASRLSAILDPRALILAAGAVYLLCALACGPLASERASAGVGSRAGGGRAFESRVTLAAVLEGLRFFFSTPALRDMLLVSSGWRLCLAMLPAALISRAEIDLGGGAGLYGLALGAIAAGGLAGSLGSPALSRLGAPAALGKAGLGLYFLSLVALGLVGGRVPFLLLCFLGNAAFFAGVVQLHSLRDASTPPALRGQVYAASGLIPTPLAIVSMIVGSALVDRIGAGAAIAACSAGALLCLVATLLPGALTSLRARRL